MSKILAIQERTKREDGQITAEEANRIKLTRSWMRSGSSNEGYGDRLTSMDDNILNSSRPFSEITKLPYLTTDARQQQSNSKETPQDVGGTMNHILILSLDQSLSCGRFINSIITTEKAASCQTFS
jgi:hypothetical protein